MRVLLVGALPPPLGGTTVLFRQLVEELAELPGVMVDIIDTSMASSPYFQGFRVLIRLLKRICRADVVAFHASWKGALLFGPAIRLVCACFHKRWIFRGFGNFAKVYGSASFLQRSILDHSILSADVILLETKSSVKYFQQISKRSVRWYPNSRPRRRCAKLSDLCSSGARRFVYMGHVKPAKGVCELIDAGAIVNADIDIHVYGPLMDGLRKEHFIGKKVKYMGILSPKRVQEVLLEYDVLLLPTYWEGEGYPGAILEGYSCGLPVIATRWSDIPEIVGCDTGLLVSPGNPKELAEAMSTLIDSPELMKKLRTGAIALSRQFESRKWTDYFLAICRGLVVTDEARAVL
jgi:glycosyltransferase involved in cell wall biosynthesis